MGITNHAHHPTSLACILLSGALLGFYLLFAYLRTHARTSTLLYNTNLVHASCGLQSWIQHLNCFRYVVSDCSTPSSATPPSALVCHLVPTLVTQQLQQYLTFFWRIIQRPTIPSAWGDRRLCHTIHSRRWGAAPHHMQEGMEGCATVCMRGWRVMPHYAWCQGAALHCVHENDRGPHYTVCMTWVPSPYHNLNEFKVLFYVSSFTFEFDQIPLYPLSTLLTP